MDGVPDELFKPDEAVSILMELLSVLSRRLKIKYRELEIEGQEEHIRAIEVIPEFRGIRVRRLLEKPEKGEPVKVIGAKVGHDAALFLMQLEKKMRTAKLGITMSDLIRLGLTLAISRLVGDEQSFRSAIQEIDYMRSRFSSWLNLAYSEAETAPEARFNQVKPSLTEYNRSSGLTNMSNNPKLDNENKARASEAVKRAIEALRCPDIRKKVSLLREAKAALEGVKTELATMFLVQVDRELERLRRLGYA